MLKTGLKLGHLLSKLSLQPKTARSAFKVCLSFEVLIQQRWAQAFFSLSRLSSISRNQSWEINWAIQVDAMDWDNVLRGVTFMSAADIIGLKCPPLLDLILFSLLLHQLRTCPTLSKHHRRGRPGKMSKWWAELKEVTSFLSILTSSSWIDKI